MRKAAFTLIELLIVIGILSILVVTILITLNPAEAQKKARDTKRMKDLATYQAIILQYIQDGNDTNLIQNNCPRHNGPNPADTTQPCITQGAGNVTSQPCDSNWLGVNLCKYTASLPIDPSNNRACTYVYGSVADPQTTVSSSCYYQLEVSGSDYEVNVLQESKSNINNSVNDGGNRSGWVEAGSNLNLD